MLAAIAAKAKTSRGTVSSVLNGSYADRRISEELAARVREAAAELGARPNAAARAMQSGRFGAVGLLTHPRGQRVSPFLGLLQGILAAAQAHQYLVSVAPLPDADEEHELPRLLRESCVDGVVIDCIEDIPAWLTEDVERSGVPAVWANVKFPEDCVHPDDYEGARAATERLLLQGRRDIVFVAGQRSAHYSQADRVAGYERAMQSAQRTPRVVYGRARDASLPSLLSKKNQRSLPDAIIAGGPQEAIVLSLEAARVGLSLPEQLSIVTFAESAMIWNYLEDLPIQVIEIPAFALGAEAVRALIARIDGGKPGPARTIPYDVERALTPPRS
jgi:LacI family transcriptional regulator